MNDFKIGDLVRLTGADWLAHHDWLYGKLVLITHDGGTNSFRFEGRLYNIFLMPRLDFSATLVSKA